ncbi:ankyrin repeat domain-containing protein [Noviherbaspirillum sp.]|uniref:ankyrin repeat domain-containing protein n=1 Tax=Noviherbaspirillum sp. TaxID=1926288 RepID=UPI002FE1D57D
MKQDVLHRLVRDGDLAGVRRYLAAHRRGRGGHSGIDTYDRKGYTPLMQAVISPLADAELVRMLLDHGADMQAQSRCAYQPNAGVLPLALGGGDPAKVRLLVERGADLRYCRAEGYTALIDAVYGRDVLRDVRLIKLLQLLIAHQVDLNAVTRYQETGCRVLSRIGRFDAVQVLLDAGADESQLAWTPLIRATTCGTVDDVARLLNKGVALEGRDWWERNAWLVAIQTGDIGKAQLLYDRGVDTGARGRCGKPALSYAIENFHAAMLSWLIDLGCPLEDTDDFGMTPLMTAAENGNDTAVDLLLRAGAAPDASKGSQTALNHACTRDAVRHLLNAGADPSQLSNEGTRAVLGLPPDPDPDLLDVTAAEFLEGRERRFGRRNPERQDSPFRIAMIRAGVTAYEAARQYEETAGRSASPVWCAKRFGQSMTFLPDGRIVQVGGEHEDSYDPDFCIYNDVFVHRPDGEIAIYGYPEADFPPTDFHSATLVGNCIYLIGSLGYYGRRRYGSTPVYRLDTTDFHIREMHVAGDRPGWIYRHVARKTADNRIRVSGGIVLDRKSDVETQVDNTRVFELDIARMCWTEIPQP